MGRAAVPVQEARGRRDGADGGAMRVRVGPLCRYTAPVADLEAWVQGAAPGEQFVYARGAALAQAAAVVLLAREYADAGFVSLVQRKMELAGGGREWEWIAQRRKPMLAQAPVASAGAAAAEMGQVIGLIDEADVEERDAILRALTRAANFGQVAPTNAELARTLGISDRHRVRYLIGKLIKARCIAIDDHGPRQRRIVTIIETGRATVPGRL